MKMKGNSTTFVLAIALVLTSAASVWPQTQRDGANQRTSRTQKQKRQGMATDHMMDRCRAMMDKLQQTQAALKNMDTELDKLVADMNSAPPDRKVNAMATVINTMVQQRKVMHERMMTAAQQMMQHAMEHTQMGKESVSRCPMMKGMMSMEDSQDHTDQEPDRRPSQRHQESVSRFTTK
jgi:alpha-D-ribose 1-methylphosphonate 5-triphosphate diphosphatase PhnM